VRTISEIELDNRNFSFLADPIKMDIFNTIEYFAVCADIAKILGIIVGKENEFFHSDETRYAWTIKNATVRHGFMPEDIALNIFFPHNKPIPFRFRPLM